MSRSSKKKTEVNGRGKKRPGDKQGESQGRVRGEAKKERGGAAKRSKKAVKARVRKEATSKPQGNKTKDLRKRQAKASMKIEELKLAREGVSKDRWVRRTRHMLIGMIYERLTSEGMSISTREMTALSRMLADHRHPLSVHIPVKTRVLRKPKCGGKGGLPETFSEVVKQVYGHTVKKS